MLFRSGISISSGAKPGMVYDYYGFPEYLYHIQYGAPGSPALAKRIHELLRSNDIRSQLDPTRGLDHGTFSIMKPLYPGEDIPVVQLSLDGGLDPMLHIAVGRALAPLRDEGVLIIGSGLSYHNLQEIRGTSGREASRKFDSWLQQTLVHASPEARVEQLQEWQKAPSAQAAHPREDHLIPLMVVVGAAESEPGAVTYHQDDLFGAITASSFRFGLAPGASPSAGEMQ